MTNMVESTINLDSLLFCACRAELQHMWVFRIYTSVISELYIFDYRLIGACVIVAAVLLGYSMTAATIFPMLAMFNIVTGSLMNVVSWGLKTYFEVMVSMDRMQVWYNILWLLPSQVTSMSS